MTDEDWAPLAPERLALPPGACDETHASRPVMPPPASRPDPEAEAALRALQQRLLQTKPSASLVASVQRRERRLERRFAAAPRVRAVLAQALVDATDDPPAHVVVDHDASDLDPRELEPWFRALPTAEQERLRAKWHGQRHRHDDLGRRCRRRLARATGYGALCFALLGIAQSLLLGGFGLLPALLGVGALAGLLAEGTGGGRFRYAVAGGLGFAVVMGPVVFVEPFGLCSLLFAAYGMGLVGMDGEMRRSAGCVDD